MRAHHWRHELISQALGGDYLTLSVSKLSLTESLLTEYAPDASLAKHTSEPLSPNRMQEGVPEDDEQSLCTVELTLHIIQGDEVYPRAEPVPALTLAGEDVLRVRLRTPSVLAAW